MLLYIEEHYFLRDPVEDVLGAGAATLAKALFAAKLLR
jgi:hypothetical protein